MHSKFFVAFLKDLVVGPLLFILYTTQYCNIEFITFMLTIIKSTSVIILSFGFLS